MNKKAEFLHGRFRDTQPGEREGVPSGHPDFIPTFDPHIDERTERERQTDAALRRFTSNLNEIIRKQNIIYKRLDDGEAQFEEVRVGMSAVLKALADMKNELIIHAQLVNKQEDAIKRQSEVYEGFLAVNKLGKLVYKVAEWIIKIGGATVIIWAVWRYGVDAAVSAKDAVPVVQGTKP